MSLSHGHAWRDFLANLDAKGLNRLEAFVAPEIHYHDPFMDAHGLVEVKRAFSLMLGSVDAPRFTFTHCACDGDTCFLRWHFTCRPKTMGHGLPWICDGVSEVRFNAEGKVVEHIEHWDAGEQVYDKIPVLRAVLRRIKYRVSGWKN